MEESHRQQVSGDNESQAIIDLFKLHSDQIKSAGMPPLKEFNIYVSPYWYERAIEATKTQCCFTIRDGELYWYSTKVVKTI